MSCQADNGDRESYLSLMSTWLMSTDGYCRLCGTAVRLGAIASEQRACCLNATTIAGVCPTHGPLGPHYVVDENPTETPDN